MQKQKTRRTQLRAMVWELLEIASRRIPPRAPQTAPHSKNKSAQRKGTGSIRTERKARAAETACPRLRGLQRRLFHSLWATAESRRRSKATGSTNTPRTTSQDSSLHPEKATAASKQPPPLP